MRIAFTMIGLVLVGACATAQTTPPPSPPPPPACATETAPYRDFDFWVGTWDVTTPDGTPAGVNVITKEEGGCLLVESWTSVTGGTGRSLNFVDPQTGAWRQVWMNLNALIDYSGGLTEDGAMKLEGAITYTTGGPSIPFLGTWTPNEDGSVTQDFKQYNAETDTWAPWFTGIYVKRED